MLKKWLLCHVCGLPFGHLSVTGPVATTLAICEDSLFLMRQPGSEKVLFIWDQRANQCIIGDQHRMEFFVGKGNISMTLAFKELAACWGRQVHTHRIANFWKPLCLKQGIIWRSPSQALGFKYQELKSMVWYEMVVLSLGFSESSRQFQVEEKRTFFLSIIMFQVSVFKGFKDIIISFHSSQLPCKVDGICFLKRQKLKYFSAPCSIYNVVEREDLPDHTDSQFLHDKAQGLHG